MAARKNADAGLVTELLTLNEKIGLHDETSEIVRRVTSGGVAGKSDDVRTVQAKRYWDLGVGTALGWDWRFNADPRCGSASCREC